MRFFLIDRITQWQEGVCAKALKNIALSEDFFDDHFPRRPVMPGVLLIEGMAQLSGLLLESGLQKTYHIEGKALLTVLERTKFRALVRPGDCLTYQTNVVALNKSGGKVTAQALCEDRVVVTTGMGFAFKTIDDPLLASKRQALMDIWMSDIKEQTSL